MQGIRRRDFIRYAGLGIATIVVGGCGGGGGGGGGGAAPAPPGGGGGGGLPPATETLNFTITDVIKEMVTHNPGGPFPNPAECYFWSFKEDRFPADCPGPQIFAIEGDVITVNVTNALDGPHSFFIDGLVDTGPIAPGATVSVTFEAKDPGSFLYYDNLNAPVNRVMGLHGAFIVMPAAAASGHKFTPYKNPGNAVQNLYDDFGTAAWWPGLAWEEGDEATGTDPFRQYVWLLHQASPVLFAEVGEFAQANPGQNYPAAQFLDRFLNDPFLNTSNDPRTEVNAAFPVKTEQFSRKPTFFTINGQSGHFAHNNPAITPMHRVGEPTLIRILNAGLWVHSMHYHANHFFVTAVNNVPQENPIWIDVFNVHPMDHVDYTMPFMRPPDVPNVRGIGRADAGLTTINGITRTWPPTEEFDRHHPAIGDRVVTNFAGTGTVDLAQRQSPLCYPMHDHTEMSQVAQGGNYNCGLIAGVNFIGDRNSLMDFPMDEDFVMMLAMGRNIGKTGNPSGNAT